MSNRNQNAATGGLSPQLFAVICACAAVGATALWTGLIYVIYRKRKQRLIQQHIRKHSLLDPLGAPRGEASAPTEKKEGASRKEEAPTHLRTTSMAIPLANLAHSRKSSYSVPPPPIPDEPIELMDKHYSQQFGKFKAVQWEGHGER